MWRQFSGEGLAFSTHGARTKKRVRGLNMYLAHYAKINSKWIIGLNVNPRTIMF